MPASAALYVRASSELQKYSTSNQTRALQKYAADHDLSVVQTYEDDGRSGLDLEGRPALLQLLQDVLDPARTFSVLLVYDISRWGRFQDTDESAHYEFLCRRAGIKVVYCAEPFDNDGSAMANIMKAIKRSMAAEYSRELSNKVALGKRRIAEQGFAQARPCFGMRRMIVTEEGAPKGIAERGQRKAIQSDRVIFVPGPPEEVAAVRRIFRMFVRQGMTYTQIAHALNREGIRTATGAPWIYERVRDLLTNELVTGALVYGKTAYRLRRERQKLAPNTWVRLPDAFEGIVPKALFRKAQKRVANLAHWTDQELLTSLRALFQREGRLTRRLIDEAPGAASAATYAARFGGLEQAYRLAGYEAAPLNSIIPTFRSLTPEAMLERLRALLARDGYLNARLLDRDPDTPGYALIKETFGSLNVAYALIGYEQPNRWKTPHLQIGRVDL